MALTKELLDILVCPRCKGAIEPSADGADLLCRSCLLAFPVRDGIPVMLLDEARKVGEE